MNAQDSKRLRSSTKSMALSPMVVVGWLVGWLVGRAKVGGWDQANDYFDDKVDPEAVMEIEIETVYGPG